MDDAADDLRALVRLLTARIDSGDNTSGGGSNSGSIVKGHSARLADAGAFFLYFRMGNLTDVVFCV